MVFAAFYNTLRDGKRCAKMLSDEFQFAGIARGQKSFSLEGKVARRQPRTDEVKTHSCPQL